MHSDLHQLDEAAKRRSIIDTARRMNASGLNRGTSGNVSLRHGEGFLVTPTSRPYDTMRPEDIIFVGLDGQAQGPWAPSSEWRFHRDIMARRADVGAIVHAHPDHATALAIQNLGIPAIHYMIAVFGGADLRCAPYAIYGSQELSNQALVALAERRGCLLAHHGMITAGHDLDHAYWLAWELETLARQYLLALTLGPPPLLSEAQIDAVISNMGGYGLTGEGTP